MLWAINLDSGASARVATLPEPAHGPTDLIHQDGWWGYVPDGAPVFWNDDEVVEVDRATDGLMVDADRWVLVDFEGSTFTSFPSRDALVDDLDGDVIPETFSSTRHALAGEVVYAAWFSTDHLEVGTLSDGPNSELSLGGYDDWVQGIDVLDGGVWVLGNETLFRVDPGTGDVGDTFVVPAWSFGLVCEG